MIKTVKFILTLLVLLFAGAIAANTLGFTAETGMVAAVVFSLILSVIPKERGIATSAIPEIWQDFLIKNLFLPSDIINTMFNADEFVEGTRVYSPVAGAKPSVKRDRASIPASAVKRSDTSQYYDIHSYTTDPIYVRNIEQVQANYKMLEAVVEDSKMAAREYFLKWLLYDIASTSGTQVIETSGDATETHLANASGTRKAVSKTDFARAKVAMSMAGAALTDRYCAMSPNMIQQLVDGLSATQNISFQQAYDPVAGVIGAYETFKIKELNETVYASDTLLKNPDTDLSGLTAATLNECAVFYQKNSAEKAMGDVKVFIKEDAPEFYGDVVSAEIFAGGRARRANQVVVLRQGATS